MNVRKAVKMLMTTSLKLDLELYPGLCRPPSSLEHQLEDVHGMCYAPNCNRPESLTSWIQIFATFNGLALIHMFLTAPETKGKTLEEMDSVFDSGIPAWKAGKIDSRLDQLQRDIEAGTVKVGPHTSSGRVENITHEPKL